MKDLMFKRQKLKTYFSIWNSFSTQLTGLTSAKYNVPEAAVSAEYQSSVIGLRGGLRACEAEVIMIVDWYNTRAPMHNARLKDVQQAIGRMMCNRTEDATSEW